MKIATERDAMARRAASSNATSALDRLSDQDSASSRKQATLVVAILSLFAGILLFKYEEVAEFLSGHEEDIEIKPDQPSQSKGGFLGGLFGGGGDDDDNYDDNDDDDGGGGGWGGIPGALGGLFGGGGGGGGKAHQPYKSASALLDDLLAARGKFDENLRADYGDYATKVFNKTSIMSAFDRPSSLSDVRLKRRMKIKVIEAQLGIGSAYNDDDDSTTFTWVTGGHSAAAGHGNLLNQSYTAAVGRAAKIVFDAVGIHFRAKARAMGGTSSGPEISLCGEAIFGQDIDVLWWDYGMTDGRDHSKYWLWANRAGSHPTFPTLITYHDRKGDIHVELEKAGQSAYQLSQIGSLREQFPDSDTHPDPNSLPRAVAWFMCGGHHENDDPCKEYKFATNPPCKEAKFQTSWHNGWKDHLLIGSASATLLANMLQEALEEMVAREKNDPDAITSISEEYLKELKSEEKVDRNIFHNSTLPSDRGDSASVDDNVWRSFLRGHPVCHGARLPSDARFLGLVTNSRNQSTHIEHGYHVGYEVGYARERDMPEPEPDNDATPPALTVLSMRQECEVPLNHDYKDAWIVRYSDKWMTGIYPNDAEAEVLTKPYADFEKAKKGYVMMCTVGCDWGKCPPGYTHVREVIDGNLTVIIDGTMAKDSVPINPDCSLLKTEDGGYSFGTGTKDGRNGQYEMKFRVNKALGKLLLSAVIVV